MNVRAIESSMRAGFPLTCASCPHLYKNADRVCGERACGGPMFGRDYPNYAGPIPRERLHERCLVCGGATLAGLITVGETRFGLCSAHLDHFQRMTPFLPKDRVYPPAPTPILLVMP